MDFIIRTVPCRLMSYNAMNEFVRPTYRSFRRDREMILFLEQDESSVSVPEGWARYTRTIQGERWAEVVMTRDSYAQTRRNLLTRRYLPVMQHRESTWNSRNMRCLIMKWDEDMILVKPKPVLVGGSFDYRFPSLNLPYEKIKKLALVIGERRQTNWAYKWLDVHLSSLKHLEEVVFIDSNALLYIQDAILGESGSWPAGSLKTYTLMPPLPREVRSEQGQQTRPFPAPATIVTSTQDGARNWGWVPMGPDGLSVVQTLEYLNMVYRVHQRGRGLSMAFVVYAVSKDTTGSVTLAKWLASM
ncbi:hypothetical protein F4810DRAFT_653031 [Camillea tinctor]|nr:hypothetical protein F4810DRAFT_653031 [Camillea tinctor]